MNEIEIKVKNQWINDYLDLLNYATKIGDKEWQENITNILHNKNDAIEVEIKIYEERYLYERFDNINSRIFEIYKITRTKISYRDNLSLNRQIQELKKEKSNLLHQIHKINKKEKV